MSRALAFTCLATLLFAAPVPPSSAADTPRRVELGAFIIDVAALDERGETFTAEFDVIARWRDPGLDAGAPSVDRLRYGPEAEAFLDTVWNPALSAVNVVGSREVNGISVRLAADGTVTLRLRMLRELRAQFDFHRFPFDRQVLPVHVESLLWDADRLAIEPLVGFSGFDAAFELPEWELLEMTTRQVRYPRPQEGGREYARLTFLIAMQRHSGYYVWKVILPMVIIVMLSWIVFWMTREYLGRRAGVSATALLTIIAYQFAVAGSLPRFPYLTVMDRFTLVALLAVAATMVVNLVGSRLSEEHRLALDRSCRIAFPLGFALLVALVLVPGVRG